MLQRQIQQNGERKALGTGCTVVRDGGSDTGRHWRRDLKEVRMRHVALRDKRIPGGGKCVHSLGGRSVFGAFGEKEGGHCGWARVDLSPAEPDGRSEMSTQPDPPPTRALQRLCTVREVPWPAPSETPSLSALQPHLQPGLCHSHSLSLGHLPQDGFF